MLMSFRDLRRFEVTGTDGRVGTVDDLLFDDRDTQVRHLVVDTGGMLKPHPVLLAPELIDSVVSEERRVGVTLDRAHIAASPPVESHPPVSRRDEDAVRGYFGLPPLHGVDPGTTADARGRPASEHRGDVAAIEREVIRRDQADPHLRSAATWLGYGVEGTGEHLGAVDDLLVEPGETWRVRHLVVDTGRWLPGEQRLVATAWIGAVSHDARCVRVDADRERMRQAPDFETAEDIDHGAERWLFRHYGFAREHE